MGIFSRREQASSESSRKGEAAFASRTSTNSSNSSNSASGSSSNGRPSNASSSLAGPASCSSSSSSKGKGIAAGLASTHAHLSPWAGIIDSDKIKTTLPSAPSPSSHHRRRTKKAKGPRNNAGHLSGRSPSGGSDSDSGSEPDLPLHWNLGKHKLEKLSLGLGIGESAEHRQSSSSSSHMHNLPMQHHHYARQQLSNAPALQKTKAASSSSDIARFSIGNMLMMVDQKMSIEEQRQAAKDEEERLKNAIDYEAFNTPRPEFDANFTSTTHTAGPASSASIQQRPFPAHRSRNAELEDVQEELLHGATSSSSHQLLDEKMQQRQNTGSMNFSSSMSSVTTLRDEVLDLLAYAKRASEGSNLEKYGLASSTSEGSIGRESAKNQKKDVERSREPQKPTPVQFQPTIPFGEAVVMKQADPSIQTTTARDRSPSPRKPPVLDHLGTSSIIDKKKDKAPLKGRFALFGGGNSKESLEKPKEKEKKESKQKDKSEKKPKNGKAAQAAEHAFGKAPAERPVSPEQPRYTRQEVQPVGLGLLALQQPAMPSRTSAETSQSSLAAPIPASHARFRASPLPSLNTNVPSSSSDNDADKAITPTKPLATSTFSSQKASAWNANASPSNSASPGSRAGIGTLLPGRKHPLASASQFDINKAARNDRNAKMEFRHEVGEERAKHGRKRSMSVPGNIFVPPRTQVGGSAVLGQAYQPDASRHEARGRASEDHKTPTQARYPYIEARQMPRSADPTLHESHSRRREVEQAHNMLAIPSPTVSNYSRASGVSPPASATSSSHPPRSSSAHHQSSSLNTRPSRPSEAPPSSSRAELRSATASPVQPALRQAHASQKSQYAQYLSVQPRSAEVRQPHSAPLPSSEWSVPSPSPSASAAQSEQRRQKGSLEKEYVIIPSSEERMKQTLGSEIVQPPTRPSRSPSPGIFAKAQAMAHASQRSQAPPSGSTDTKSSHNRRQRNTSDDSVLDPILPSIATSTPPLQPVQSTASRTPGQAKVSNTPVPIQALSITKTRSPKRSPVPSPSVSVSSISAIGPPPASPLPLPPPPQPAAAAQPLSNKVTIQLKAKLPSTQPAMLPRETSEPSLLAYRYASDQSIPSLADKPAAIQSKITKPATVRRDTASSEHASFSDNSHISASTLSNTSSIGSRPSLSMEGSSSEDGEEAEDDLTSLDSHGDSRYHGLLRGMLRSGTDTSIPEGQEEFEDEGYGKAINSPPTRAGQTVPTIATRYTPAKRAVYPQATAPRAPKTIPTSESHDRLTQIYSDIVGELASED